NRRPDRILQAPAQPRQAVRGDGRHLARELPSKELPDGLSHPALVLLAAGTGVPGVETRGNRALAAGGAEETVCERLQVVWRFRFVCFRRSRSTIRPARCAS